MFKSIFISIFTLCLTVQAKDKLKIWPYVYSERGTRINLAWQAQKSADIQQKDVTGQYNYYKKLPLESETARISFFADTQEGTDTDEEFAILAKSFDPHAVIVGGDLVQNGDKEQEWVDFFKSMKDITLGRLMIPVVGNHEYRHDRTVPLWKKYFNFDAYDAFYDLWVGPVHIVVLNTNFEDDPSLVDRQLLWLERVLMVPAPWTFVTFHQPPFSRSIMQMGAWPRKEHLLLREKYVPLFEKYKVDLVLNGHTHIYERSFRNGVHYLTTGAAGGKMGHGGATNYFESIEPIFEKTIVQIEVAPGLLGATAVSKEKQVIDSFIIKK